MALKLSFLQTCITKFMKAAALVAFFETGINASLGCYETEAYLPLLLKGLSKLFLTIIELSFASINPSLVKTKEMNKFKTTFKAKVNYKNSFSYIFN